MSEDAKEPEDKQVLVKASRLSGPRTRVGHDKQVMLSKETNLLGKQSGSLKSDHPTSTMKWTTMLGRRISLGKRRVNKELRNIWEKNCYHHIAYSTPNQLATLRWR